MIFKKIRKGHADWRNFLCSTPAMDYVFQKDAYEDQIDRAAENIRNADCVIIGAGAGASTAAGIQYGGNMAMNLRCDNYFVEDEAWHEAADRYAGFVEQNKDKKVVLLELGVGFNTPIIIRFPFEKMVRENSSYSLIRLNMDEAVVPESFGERAIGIGGDMAKAITDIRGLVL